MHVLHIKDIPRLFVLLQLNFLSHKLQMFELRKKKKLIFYKHIKLHKIFQKVPLQLFPQLHNTFISIQKDFLCNIMLLKTNTMLIIISGRAQNFLTGTIRTIRIGWRKGKKYFESLSFVVELFIKFSDHKVLVISIHPPLVISILWSLYSIKVNNLLKSLSDVIKMFILP